MICMAWVGLGFASALRGKIWAGKIYAQILPRQYSVCECSHFVTGLINRLEMVEYLLFPSFMVN